MWDFRKHKTIYIYSEGDWCGNSELVKSLKDEEGWNHCFIRVSVV